MSYDPHGLFCLSYAHGFTLWHYRSPDSLELMRTRGYFDPAHHMVRDGDRLCLNAATAEGLMVAAQDFVVCQREGHVALAPSSPPVFPGRAFLDRLSAGTHAAYCPSCRCLHFCLNPAEGGE